VTLVGKHPPKLQIVQRRGIETLTIDKASTRTRTFDVVVEASDRRPVSIWHSTWLHPRGTLVLKSTIRADIQIRRAVKGGLQNQGAARCRQVECQIETGRTIRMPLPLRRTCVFACWLCRS